MTTHNQSSGGHQWDKVLPDVMHGKGCSIAIDVGLALWDLTGSLGALHELLMAIARLLGLLLWVQSGTAATVMNAATLIGGVNWSNVRLSHIETVTVLLGVATETATPPLIAAPIHATVATVDHLAGG
jgi:hypothetical protein